VVKMRYSLLWDVVQRRLVVVTEISEKLIGPIFRGSNITGRFFLLLKFGPIGCPEASITNYQPKPRKIPEEQRFYFVWLQSLCIF
jgi:hypothetical protein